MPPALASAAVTGAASTGGGSAVGGSYPLFPIMTPASDMASSITTLMWITLVFGGLVFLAVVACTFWFVRRYRFRGAEGEPPQIFGNAPEEIAGMIGAAVILVVIFGVALSVIGKASPATAGVTPDFTVVARQWYWEAQYPNGARSANEIHIPAGRRVLLRLRSGDVIHDFWALQLGRKLDVIPGQDNLLWLEADRPGRYAGACSEYCGAQHAWMRFVVVAQPPAEYRAWLAATATPAPSTRGAAAQSGELLFASSGCPACHAVQGSGANGRVGPDLTHFGARGLIAGAVLTNTPEHLTRWLRDPQQVKPGTRMPRYPFDHTQLAQLTAYLEGLK